MKLLPQNPSVNSNPMIINGDKGPYDNKVKNNSVRYGRNASANMLNYTKSFSKPLPNLDVSSLKTMNKDNYESSLQDLDKQLDALHSAVKAMPPMNFEMKYMPGKVNSGNLDKNALLGSAFEEMGGKTSMPVSEMNGKVQKGLKNADPSIMDLNHDNKIDVGEYSASILLEDMAGKDGELKKENISGTINNKGENTMAALFSSSLKDKTSKMLAEIYKTEALDAAQKEFEKDPNNTESFNIQG